MLANRTSRWSIGAVLLCIALLAAAWFLLISPRRADAGTVRTQVVSVDSKANELQLEIAQLKVEFADLPKRRAQLKAIKIQLPPKGNMPAMVRQMQKLAAAAGVSLDSITPGTPAVLTAPGAPAAATAGPGAVVTVPMTLDVTGDYFEASLFVKNLQTKIKRSFLISSIDVTAAKTEVLTPTITPTGPITPITPTGVPTTSPGATPTVAPTAVVTPTGTPTTIANPLEHASLTITGAMFVLLDTTSTLDSVAKDAKAAASGPQGTTTTPTTGPTSSPLAG